MSTPQLEAVYDKSFFDDLTTGSGESASYCTEIIYELLKPQTAVDIGCGRGEWLCELVKLGVSDVYGIDSTDLPESDLMIRSDQYSAGDLTQPVDLGRTFDLAMSLEVGEHLPDFE